jgi:hypothetical protein
VAEIEGGEFAQKIDEETGLYLKVDRESGEVVKRKTTLGPYKGIPLYEIPEEEESPSREEREEEIVEAVMEKEKEVTRKILEKEPSEGGSRGNKVESKVERTLISLDDSIGKIVSLDKEGVALFFEDEPGRFRELPDEIVDGLSKINRERYRTSRDFNKRRVREEEHPEEFKTSGITINPRYSTARARLRVEGGRPGFHYCWKAPHELTTAARLGYRIAKSPGLQTFSNEGEETHRVSAFGEDELVLTEVPKETHDAILKYHSDKSRRRVETMEDSGAAEIRAAGGLPFDPKKARPGLRWSRYPNSEEQ